MLSNKTRVVVVPSPTSSSVFIAASFIRDNIVFTIGLSSSIDLAIVTPSLVIKGV